jgi:hypothetical protein
VWGDRDGRLRAVTPHPWQPAAAAVEFISVIELTDDNVLCHRRMQHAKRIGLINWPCTIFVIFTPACSNALNANSNKPNFFSTRRRYKRKSDISSAGKIQGSSQRSISDLDCDDDTIIRAVYRVALISVL